MQYGIIPLREGIWAIEDGNVRMYLLCGGSKSILIDTGYGSGDLLGAVSTLVRGPVTVVHTHSHDDHTGGDRQFYRFLMHEADAAAIRPHCPPSAEIGYVGDGAVIAAGEVRLEVVAIPGHTPGSIALLDRTRRMLFSGDTFAKHYPVYMQYPGQDCAAYLRSMERLQALAPSYDTLCPCHGALHIEKEYIARHIACCQRILDGTAAPATAKLFDGTDGRAAWYEDVAIFY